MYPNEFTHLYYRAKRRYHAFEWLLTDEDGKNVGFPISEAAVKLLEGGLKRGI